MADQQGSYAAEAGGVALAIGALVALAEKFEQLALGEQRDTIKALEQVPVRFTNAAKALDTARTHFWQSAGALLSGWRSKVESRTYEAAVAQSVKSLSDSSEALTGQTAGGPSQQGGNLGAQISTVIGNINTVANNATQVANAIRTQQTLMQEPGAQFADTTGVLNGLKQQLVGVGQGLDQLGGQYIAIGRQALGMANAMRWQGPHSDVSGGEPTRSPGSVPTAPGGGPAGGPGSGPAGGEQPEGGQTGAQTQPGGGETGADQPGGGTAGGPGEQTGPGGTELTGTTPTLPKPVPLTPITPLPPLDATPTPPIAPLTPVTPVSTGRGSSGYTGGGLSGAGRGGIGSGVGTGGSKLGGIKPLENPNQQIPSVVKAGQPEGAVSTGRAPSLPAAPGAGSGGGTPGGSSIPPMMPPMGGAGAGAGSGRAGKPGAGAIRPTGRERVRTNGPTPGVPDGLRGKSAKKGAFPAAPVATASARRDRERQDTLQILDEELWTVETAPEAAHQQPTRRLAT